jgi:hypothetical protein
MSKLLDSLVYKAIEVLTRSREKAIIRNKIDQIKSSYSKLKVKKTLSKEQKEEIQDFYKKTLGYKVPLEWHEYFNSRTGIYSKLYIPTSEYKLHIIGRLNTYPLHLAYNDKNMTDVTLPNTHQPHIYLKNMGGYYYASGNPISREEALELCKNLGDVIIKPSLTGRGKKVKKIHIENGITDYDGKTLSDVFDIYRADFLVQRVIKQHKDMAALNPSSINTIRIVTYRHDMDVDSVYTVVRIGRKGMNVDNESAGGISAIIRPDGTIGKYAYGAPGVDKVEYTDSGVLLEGYAVPSYDKAIELVKESHMHLPYFNLIGWDIAIEEDGTPIMIEFNLNPDLSQSANGPAFGEFTEMILKDAMSRRNSWTPSTMAIMNMRNYRLK